MLERFRIHPVRISVDYKPKYVDYEGLIHGKFAELLNVFQLDGAEICLPEIDLRGVSGWTRVLEDIMHIWIPHITKTQIINMAAGVGPVRTVANVGSGVMDLLLLPIEQYKKDGRILPGSNSLYDYVIKILL